MSLDGPQGPSQTNLTGTIPQPTFEERILENIARLEHQLRLFEPKSGLPDWGKKAQFYKVVEVFNEAVAFYNSAANAEEGPSEKIQKIDWEGFRQKIFKISLGVPQISKLTLPNGERIEQNCFGLKDETLPVEMICIEEGIGEVECQYEEPKFEKPNEKLFFCKPEKWNPSKLLTRKPKVPSS